jgi:transglutaminase-like putative cysteine protease
MLKPSWMLGLVLTACFVLEGRVVNAGPVPILAARGQDPPGEHAKAAPRQGDAPTNKGEGGSFAKRLEVLKPSPTRDLARLTKFAGNWRITATHEGKVYHPLLNLREAGGRLVGTYVTDDAREVTPSDLTVDGARLSFRVSHDFGGQPTQLKYVTTYSSGSLTGSIEFELGDGRARLPFEARLEVDKDPERAEPRLAPKSAPATDKATSKVAKSKTPASKEDEPGPVAKGPGAPEGYVIIWDFDATKARPTPEGEVLVPLPSQETYQRVRWDVSGVDSRRVLDAEGGRLLAVVPRDRYFRLRIAVEPLAREAPPLSNPRGLPADAVACLQANADLAERNPEVANLARQLKDEGPTQTIENLRRWIKYNMSYFYDPGLKAREVERIGGIDSTLEARKGDCGAHANLFVSLCRLAGVPARVVWGPVRMPGSSPAQGAGPVSFESSRLGPIDPETGLPKDMSKLGDFSGHAWAEVYLKDRGWVPLETVQNLAPLGRVPEGYVPFTRQGPGLDALSAETSLALTNVGLMNYFPRLERPDEARPSAARTGPGNSSKTKN